MNTIYKDEYLLYLNKYKRTFKKVLLIGFIVSILSYALGLVFEEFILEQTKNMANEMDIQKNQTETSFQKFLSISLHNITLSIGIIVSGLIPVYGVPIIFSIASFAAVGILASYGVIMEKDVVKTMSIAFFPHAIIEVIPILYSITVGLYLNKSIISRVYKKNPTLKLKVVLFQSVKSLVIIIIPLFILAALVESYITSFLVHKLL